MKKVLESVSKGILYFVGGVFFTLFIFTVIVVVLLYNETTELKKEISELKGLTTNSFPELKPEVKRIIPDTIIEEDPEVSKPASIPRGIGWGNWQNLKTNMTADEVINQLGNPTQVISLIDTTKYIYKDDRYEGYITFNRQMRVIGWNRV